VGLSLERIFGEMPDVPFRDHVWPKFLRENANPRSSWTLGQPGRESACRTVSDRRWERGQGVVAE